MLQPGKKAKYGCVSGYKLEDQTNDDVSAKLECLGNSSYADWEGPRPNCERKYKPN